MPEKVSWAVTDTGMAITMLRPSLSGNVCMSQVSPLKSTRTCSSVQVRSAVCSLSTWAGSTPSLARMCRKLWLWKYSFACDSEGRSRITPFVSTTYEAPWPLNTGRMATSAYSWESTTSRSPATGAPSMTTLLTGAANAQKSPLPCTVQNSECTSVQVLRSSLSMEPDMTMAFPSRDRHRPSSIIR